MLNSRKFKKIVHITVKIILIILFISIFVRISTGYLAFPSVIHDTISEYIGSFIPQVYLCLGSNKIQLEYVRE